MIVPVIDSEVGILPNHTPLMTLLGDGTLTVHQGATVSRFIVHGGVVDNRVRVVAEHVQRGSHAL